jgi:hypothetical protein
MAGAVCACEHGAGVIVTEVRAHRDLGGHVVVDVDIVAVEQSGRDVGRTCVSAHWLGGIDPSVVGPAPSYAGELDVVTTCFDGFRDGDARTIHLVSNKASTDLPVGSALRAQAIAAKSIHVQDIDNP